MTIDPAALRALLEKATARPWSTAGALVTGPDRKTGDVADCSFGVVLHGETQQAAHADADLICAAVNALPALLAVYEVACAAIDERRPFADNTAQYRLALAVDAARSRK